ncbi:MAG: carboxymuconolactone decarboxylase family protein, partial [Pelagibacterales bacterium]|nr:carboxymuconolactone decarboxylase family protein [Pelagibacterales bacterium]
MRIKDWNKEDLSEEQLSIYKEIINGPRGNVIGPIRIWLNNP